MSCKKKRGRSPVSEGHKTPSRVKRRLIASTESSAEDSDASGHVKISSFYSRSKTSTYLSPLERSKLRREKQSLTSEDSANEEKEVSHALKESNRNVLPVAKPGVKKLSSSKHSRENTPKFKSTSLSVIKKSRVNSTQENKLSPRKPANSEGKRFFKNQSPGKKVNVINRVGKVGFHLSFQSKKIKQNLSFVKSESGNRSKTNNILPCKISPPSTFKNIKDTIKRKEKEEKEDKESGVMEKVIILEKDGRKTSPVTFKHSMGKNQLNKLFSSKIDLDDCQLVKNEGSVCTTEEQFDNPAPLRKEDASPTSSIDSCSVVLLPDVTESQPVESDTQNSINVEHETEETNHTETISCHLITPKCTGKLRALAATHSPTVHADAFLPTPESKKTAESELNQTPRQRKDKLTIDANDFLPTPEPVRTNVKEITDFSSKSVDKDKAKALTTPKHKKISIKKLVNSPWHNFSTTTSFQAEDFLPTPEPKNKNVSNSENSSPTSKSPSIVDSRESQRPETADTQNEFPQDLNGSKPKVFPIFSRPSSKADSVSDDSLPTTPRSSASRMGLSDVTDSPRRPPSKTATPAVSPRRSPRKSNACTPGSAKRPSPSLWKKLKERNEKSGLSQMTLDFGQKYQKVGACPVCGMTYTHGDPADEATHAQFHAKLNSTLRFKGWRKERVMQEFDSGARVLMVLPEEKLCMKKVEAVKKIVDEDLGFVVENLGYRRHAKAFLYVTSSQKIVGFCLAELISQAYKIKPEEEVQNAGSPTKRRRPWSRGETPHPARCGINRIWVLRRERQGGIASQLLDCVRYNFIMGDVVQKSELAFSDPTPDGIKFATRYTGDSHFLVYNWSSN